MLSFHECQKIINQKLNEVKLPGLPSNLYDPIKYMLDLEAKRIRPSIVLMACNVFSEDVQAAIFPALAIEVFHNFTLVHDDIMDKSDIRRNRATVHVKWNPDIAVLSGDAMLIKSYELLSLSPSAFLGKILPIFNQTALEVCEGQQYDMDYEKHFEVNIGDYLKMVEYKTAVLLAASFKIGAIAGGATIEQSEDLYNFGKDLGIAFQLQDDLLDVFADASVFGKVNGNDIVTNKKTILLIEALNSAKGEMKEKLMSWINRETFNREEKVNSIRNMYQQLKLDERVNGYIRKYHESALLHLKNLAIEEHKKTELLRFSEKLMNRKK
jgi:geranylgeranyl diphosphate synthase type II